MKFLIIQQSNKHSDIRDDAGMLGLLYIATYLKDYRGFTKTVLVDSVFENPLEKIEKEKPDIVGISSMTISLTSAINLGNLIKNRFNLPLIIGGVHISTLPESLPDIFDVGVVGEGEETTLELLQNFEKNGELKNKNIKGLVFRCGNKIIQTPKRLLIEPLDKIPIPDRSYISKKYFEPIPDWSGKRLRKASMMTSRGCIYKCRFCSTSAFWEKIRFNSAERVANELGILKNDYKVEVISIMDDTFTLNKTRLNNIAKLMKENGLIGEIKLDINARANTITEDICKTLKKIGVQRINFGFESGNDRLLRWLKRETVTIEDNKKAINICSKYGFKIIGSLIFGSPTETINEMKDTIYFIDWMHERGVEDVWFFIATPYPKTEFWEIAEKKRLVSINMNWDKLNLVNFNNPILLDENIDRKEFNEIIKIATEKKTKYFDVNNKIWMCRSPFRNLISLFSKTETAVSKPKLIYELSKKGIKIFLSKYIEKKYKLS